MSTNFWRDVAIQNRVSANPRLVRDLIVNLAFVDGAQLTKSPDFGPGGCILCGASQLVEHYPHLGHSPDDPADHRKGCPWRLAKELYE